MNQPQTREIRKQISIFVPLSDWRIVRDEAIRRRQPMTELCRGWMEPHLSRLRGPRPRHALSSKHSG
ncbi:MAG TPA: hypothetical protein VML55_17835 [Planctomycetaceae bacterium]|nr:hypothetical protein [Planctomycetaceae bacterium]